MTTPEEIDYLLGDFTRLATLVHLLESRRDCKVKGAELATRTYAIRARCQLMRQRSASREEWMLFNSDIDQLFGEMQVLRIALRMWNDHSH